MEITYRKVGELVPYVNNARTHSDEQVAQICASIREYGWTNPVLIDENGMIIAGHGRVMAAQRMKMEQVPCIVLSGLTEAQKKAYVIADNKMALNAGWDDEKLKLELENLKELDFDLELTGFDSDELDQLLSIDDIEELPEDIDDVPEPPKEAKSKLGDIYKLGNHRLMCGDSTKLEDIEKLMDGKKADMVFTDPPYGMNLDTDYSKMNGNSNVEFKQKKNIVGGKKYNEVIGDNEDFKPELVTTIFDNFDYCKEIFVWGADYYPELLKGYKDGNFIIWDKRDDNEQFDKMYGSSFEVCWSKNKHRKEIARVRWCGVFGTEKEFDKKRVHPTQKPIKLAEWFLKKYSKDEHIVVDLFGGSGSTLIACEQLKRKCFMMEFDPVYCDVIIERWEKFTGRKAVKVNG